MDAYKAIITKRDTRAYTEAPIADDVINRVLQAGRMAGSSKNTQPIRLIVTRDHDRLLEWAECGTFSEPLKTATAAIAICASPSGSDFDAGRAAQNLMVAAWNEGLASCPTSMHNQDCIRGKLNLPQDEVDDATGRTGWRCVVIIALGHPRPDVPMSMGRKRLEADDYARWESW